MALIREGGAVAKRRVDLNMAILVRFHKLNAPTELQVLAQGLSVANTLGNGPTKQFSLSSSNEERAGVRSRIPLALAFL